MNRTARVLVSALISPLVAIMGFFLLIVVLSLSMNHFQIHRGDLVSWSKVIAALSYLWFCAFFAPIAYVLHRNRSATFPHLIALGASTGGLFASSLLLLTISLMGMLGAPRRISPGCLPQAPRLAHSLDLRLARLFASSAA
jgi:hypothetical protein